MKVKISLKDGRIPKQALMFVKHMKEGLGIGLKEAKEIVNEFIDDRITYYIADIYKEKFQEFRNNLNDIGVILTDQDRTDKLNNIIKLQRIEEIEEKINSIKNIVYESLGSVITEDKANTVDKITDELLIEFKNLIK